MYVKLYTVCIWFDEPLIIHNTAKVVCMYYTGVKDNTRFSAMSSNFHSPNGFIQSLLSHPSSVGAIIVKDHIKEKAMRRMDEGSKSTHALSSLHTSFPPHRLLQDLHPYLLQSPVQA